MLNVLRPFNKKKEKEKKIHHLENRGIAKRFLNVLLYYTETISRVYIHELQHILIEEYLIS